MKTALQWFNGSELNGRHIKLIEEAEATKRSRSVPETANLDDSNKENIPLGGNERKRKKSSSMILCSP